MGKVIRESELTEETIAEIAETLRSGGVAILPTETVYGIFCSYDDESAIRRIFEIKRRPQEKILTLTLADVAEAKKYVELASWQEKVIEEFLPGPVTFVFKPVVALSEFLVSREGKTGIRIPDSPATRKIIRATGKPLASTSANLSGMPSPASFEEIEKELIEAADVSLDAGICEVKVPSTVFDLSFYPGKVIREGAVSPEAIIQASQRFLDGN